MPDPTKTITVTFKTEKKIADFLNKLPNKSAFIRKAIETQLGAPCPTCKGKGFVPHEVKEQGCH